ncbi:MAG: proton-conducting transporter membrane subunit [Mangrovibacterium sp.]
MDKLLFELFNVVTVFTILCIPFLNTKGRGILTLGVVTLLIIISSILSVNVFIHGPVEIIYPGSWITGEIPIRIDYLSAWFMLIINFTFLTGGWYGFRYMKKYMDQTDNITLHVITFLLLYTSLIDLCTIQNSFVMLVVWEIMALSSFIVVIFEHYKKETLKAGINFLIQSHICILFLTMAFLWVKIKTGSFDFTAITKFTATQPMLSGIGLFVFFFFGFAIKAGFVPFHTWLPLAHPAAPSHISGIMSGVIIKIGIYGMLRVLMLIRTDMVTIGYFVLFFAVITGVYGVMLAIVQHNLKKLLAYHSIENIGIIGIGIGLGCLGLGYDSHMLAVAGFGGALLHTLNHSLFKSLLFFGAGNVYLTRHTLNIEALGGLIKRIPHTAYLFLIGSLAICGLPPFNGFVSEFFIYSGLFKGLSSDLFLFILTMLFSILALVLIGGLALICFTKAFGIVFLGSPRENYKEQKTNSKLKTQDTSIKTQDIKDQESGINSKFQRINPKEGTQVSGIKTQDARQEGRPDMEDRTPEELRNLGTPKFKNLGTQELRNLGTQELKNSEIQEKARNVLPLYLIAAAIVFVGLFPFLLNQPLGKTLTLYVPEMSPDVSLKIRDLLNSLTKVGWVSLGFVALSTLIYFLRTRIVSQSQHSTDTTWGCGYTGDAAKMQYTASSFIRTYRKLAEPVLLIKKLKKDARGLYPDQTKQETHPGDWIESLLIDKPLALARRFLSKFVFLQNGNIQAYLLYGFIFISLAVILPVVFGKIRILIEFLNHL